MNKYHLFFIIMFVVMLIITVMSLVALKIEIDNSQKIDTIQTTLNNWTLNE